jgi:hypothetical protein
MIVNTTPNEESDHHATRNGGRTNDVRERETRYDRANEKNTHSTEKSPTGSGIKEGGTTMNVMQHAFNYAISQ